MNLDTSIRALYQAETDLTQHLHALAADHDTQPEIHHSPATWSARHADTLRQRYHLHPHPQPGPIAAIRKAFPGGLLDDLRSLHLAATAVSLDWELLGQGAQAVKDAELLALTKQCHPETLRQSRWGNAMLTNLSPQILASQS